MDRVVVKIADYRIAANPAILSTYGLGSCIAVALYDPEIRIAGMGHIMLPKGDGRRSDNQKKFADLCISEMLGELEGRGCKAERMSAKMAGGASMFDLPYNESFCIGERNRVSVINELLKRRIPLVGEDTGGNYGRSVDFHTENGMMVIKSIRYGTKVI